MYSFSIRQFRQFIWEYIGDFFFWRESSLMYSFSIRHFIWEYIGDFFWESSLMYSFSIRQFIWECIGGFFWRENSLMYSFSIRQFIWEYIGDYFFGKFPCVFVFHWAIHLEIHRWIFLGGERFPYVFVFN